MVGRLRIATAIVAAVTVVAASGPGPAASAPAPGAGLAHSAAAQVNPSAGIATSTSVTVLGAIKADLLTTNLVDPLVNAAAALPNSMVAGLSAGLIGAGLQADNPANGQPRPSAGQYPTCGQQGWTAGDCYGPLVPTVSAGSLLALGTGTVQGFATGDSHGYLAAAHAADVQLSLLGVPLGDLGVIDSTASCTNPPAPVCTPTQALSGGSLLAGALRVSIASGQLVATLNGASIPAAGRTITLAGLSITVALTGNLLTLKIALSLDQLLGLLGLPNLLSALGALGVVSDNGTSAALTVTLGPGNTASTGSTTASWGLQLGLDLSATVALKVNLFIVKLATISVGIGAKTPAPDLVDLRLAFSTAGSGTPLAGWVPPGLI
jgi:hypothetical protein